MRSWAIAWALLSVHHAPAILSRSCNTCRWLSAKKAISATAAQLLLLVYNLWTLYMRLLEPRKHVEAVRSRRWFLLIAGRLVESGRQKALSLSVQGAWWQELKECYERVSRWLRAT